MKTGTIFRFMGQVTSLHTPVVVKLKGVDYEIDQMYQRKDRTVVIRLKEGDETRRGVS